MATSPQKTESLQAISREIVAGDAGLQAELKQLITASIKMAVHTMKFGMPAEKMAMMKMLTPHMLEALRQTQQSEAKEAERAAYERILKELRGEVVEEMGNGVTSGGQ